MGKLVDAVQKKVSRVDENKELFSAKNELSRFDTKRLNCEIPSDIYKQLQLKVVQNDTSITAVVNQMVRDYVSLI